MASSTHRRPHAWHALQFGSLFLGLILLYAVTFSSAPVERFLHAPVSRAVALSCFPVLSLLGQTSLASNSLEFEGFRAVVVEACNGVLPSYIFLAAIVAFPCSWRDKLRGAALGVPLIFLINVFRVISLMILGAKKPEIVERVHIDVWQTAVVVLAIGIWIFWAERIVHGRPAVRR